MTANNPQEWIKSMLDAKFHESCNGGHPKCQTCTHFCKDCDSNKVFCKNCVSKHIGHTVIQVRVSPSDFNGGYFTLLKKIWWLF